MAINTKDTGLITAATTYSSIQGTMQVEFTNGDVINVNSDKLRTDNLSFGMRGAGSGYAGHRFLGSSFGVTAQTALTNNILITEGILTATLEVKGGVGKVSIRTRVGTADVPEVYVPVTVDNVISSILPIGTRIEQGAIIFGRSGGTASTVFSKFNQPPALLLTATRDFVDGSGTATLANGDFSTTMRLDEINFPVRTVAGDTVELLGGSVLFV